MSNAEYGLSVSAKTTIKEKCNYVSSYSARACSQLRASRNGNKVGEFEGVGLGTRPQTSLESSKWDGHTLRPRCHLHWNSTKRHRWGTIVCSMATFCCCLLRVKEKSVQLCLIGAHHLCLWSITGDRTWRRPTSRGGGGHWYSEGWESTSTHVGGPGSKQDDCHCD